MQTTYDAVVALTDAFCRDHLTDEYRDLPRAMSKGGGGGAFAEGRLVKLGCGVTCCARKDVTMSARSCTA